MVCGVEGREAGGVVGVVYNCGEGVVGCDW